MRLPDFLPPELNSYDSYDEDEALFRTLSQKPMDLLTFFEYGVGDDPWANHHITFIKLTLRWAAKQYYLGKVSEAYAKSIGKIIQDHYGLLQPFLLFRPALFFTFRLKIEDQQMLVNSLLFGTSTPFFKNLFLSGYNSLIDDWQLTRITLNLFHQIEEYIIKGEIKDLWRHDKDQVYALMKQAKDWQLPGLEKECAEILKRYFSKDKILDVILDSQRHFFIPYKTLAFEFFNHHNEGMRFLLGRDSDLKIEILDYKQETLELFAPFAPWVTHLAFSGDLSNEPEFHVLIESCPKLVGIDLSASRSYTGQFSSLPSHLIEMNLSACPWVKPEILQQASVQFPSLKTLELASNVHLNFQTWGMLSRFHQLISLNLSRCHQIDDEDLKQIEKACPHLIEINLEECRQITNKGIGELLLGCRGLINLDISRSTLLTDKTLAEIGIHGNQITHLKLMHGKGFSERGLLQMLRMRSNLSYLNIRGCDFSLQTLAKIKKEYPFLKLED
jgi:F-box and leucine-rich repeat protein 2/20